MTLKNNRAPFLCYLKLWASFLSHWWIQTGVTVRKRPIWLKFDNILSRVTLKFGKWPWTSKSEGFDSCDWPSNLTHIRFKSSIFQPLSYSPETPNLGQNRWFFLDVRGVTIRLATIRYISRYTTHDMVHDTIQNQLIYYQWKILKHCGMCHQYCYIKTVILARNSEFKINKDVHNHPCPKYLLLTNCVCKQNNKIS